MSADDITRHENEAAAARARLTATTHTVTHAATGAAFKDEVTRAVNDVKNDAMTSVQSSGNTWVTTLRDELVSRANANPLAAAAIVGGVGWKLLRHPPVSLLLTAAGIYGLSRTDPKVKSLTASDIMSKGRHLVAEGQHMAEEAIQQTKEYGQSAMQSGADLVEGVSASSRKMAKDVREQVGKIADGTSQAVSSAKSQAKARIQAADLSGSMRKASDVAASRDAMLLGFAVLAVGAAVGLAYGQSGDTEDD